MCTNPVAVDGVFLSCGACQFCQKKRRNEWTVRLFAELSYWNDACFLTLTYNEENLPEGSTLVKRDLQLFLKRLRRYSGKYIKYYAAGEYGEKYGRPHYHLILFGLGLSDREVILRAWTSGFIHLDTVNEKTIRYTAKYLQKEPELRGRRGKLLYKHVLRKEPPFKTCSQGLGLRYVLDNRVQLRKDKFLRFKGFVLGLPRYFRKVLFLTADDFSEYIQKKVQFLKQFLFESELTPPEREHYKKYGLYEWTTYPSVARRFKAYLANLEKDALVTRYEFSM